MADIQLEIEGSGAVAATEDLLSIPGLSGNWSPAVEDTQREGVLVTIATIVAITTGTITIAEKIYAWYQKAQQAQPSPTVEKAMLIGRNGERILLKNATVEQIRQILDA
jgi:hypothetical protein